MTEKKPELVIKNIEDSPLYIEFSKGYDKGYEVGLKYSKTLNDADLAPLRKVWEEDMHKVGLIKTAKILQALDDVAQKLWDKKGEK